MESIQESLPSRTDPCAAGRKRIQGSGEMAEAIRGHSWEATRLGEIEGWPSELVTAVNMMLASKVPTTIQWGPDLLVFYNDCFIPNLQGKHPQALGTPFRMVWAEAYEQVAETFARPFRDGEAFSFPASPFDLLVDDKLVRKWYSYAGTPIWGETPDEARVLGIYQTATDETEAQLVSARLDQVLEATSDGVAYMDRDWRITYLNERGKVILGSKSEVIGKNLWEEFPATLDEDAPFLSAYYRAMDDGIASHFDVEYPEPLNAWFDITCQPATDGIVVFFRDITERKKAQQALMQSEKLAAVGRLSASIAHEINNPLESVTNLLYLVRNSEDVDEIRSYTDTAERELRRVSLIANQTLRFHRQSTKAEAAYCYDLIGDSLAIFQGRLVNNKVQVEKRKRAEHPVECLSGEIRQVLNNLIGNAIDAMPLGGRLLMRSREAIDYTTGRRGLVLTVADTGIGMPPDVQKRVFDAFYTTKGIGGTGLGLWISSEIVARHGGRLRFRSRTGPGRSGTVFTLFLPYEAQ